jgi:hypothetical protein
VEKQTCGTAKKSSINTIVEHPMNGKCLQQQPSLKCGANYHFENLQCHLLSFQEETKILSK